MNEAGADTLVCELVTIGPQFSPTGFGLGFVKTAPISVPFSRAIQILLRDGVIDRYVPARDLVASSCAVTTASCDWRVPTVLVALLGCAGW